MSLQTLSSTLLCGLSWSVNQSGHFADTVTPFEAEPQLPTRTEEDEEEEVEWQGMTRVVLQGFAIPYRETDKPK